MESFPQQGQITGLLGGQQERGEKGAGGGGESRRGTCLEAGRRPRPGES